MRRNPGEAKNLGIVIDRRIANSENTRSAHMKHLIGACMQVCYVFFTEEGISGPFYESDLVVKQTGHASFSMET